jgi:small-conductance mechanosensitive channel
MHVSSTVLADAAGRLDALVPEWLASILYLAAAAVVLVFLHTAALQILRMILRGRLEDFGRKLLDNIGPPTRLGVLVVGLGVLEQALPHPGRLFWILEWLLLFGVVIFVGWIAIAVINTAAELYLRRVPLGSEDSALTRKHLTQVRLLRRIAVFVVGFLTFSALLMTIPSVREYGVSLFASAGVAGLAVGLAARPVLSNLIAGVQIAITQPIRLGDNVLVEGEFGTVDEIQTTYVVLRLWDLRRLVVPLSYFMEKPFQNWTRDSPNLIGTVYLYVDYAAPVEQIRAKFLEIVKASPLWDGQVAALQVSDASDRTLQLRAIMSAASSGKSWDLRCEMREKLVAWLREAHPKILPRTRMDVEAATAPMPGAHEH